MHQLWSVGRELESIPVDTIGTLDDRAACGVGKRHILGVIPGSEDRLSERDLHRIFPAMDGCALDRRSERPLIEPQLVLPGVARSADGQRRKSGARDSELEVEIGIARVERLRSDYHAALPQFQGYTPL